MIIATKCGVVVDFTSPMRAFTADILQPFHSSGRLKTKQLKNTDRGNNVINHPRQSHPLGELFLTFECNDAVYTYMYELPVCMYVEA